MSTNRIFLISSFALVLISLLPSNSFAVWPFGPNNYEECISREMKGVTSDVAARAIIDTCRNRFSGKKKATVELPHGELAKITGSLSEGVLASYVGNIYNGSSYIVTSLFIEVTTSIFGNDYVGDTTRVHKVTKKIDPYKTEFITFDAPEKGTWFKWKIKTAWGYREEEGK